MLTYVLLWAVLSLAWNILSGYAGYFSFGHAVFWGLGAYTVALGMLWFHLTPWVSIPICAVVGAAAGALIGYPTFRLRGHYFALAMLAYPLAIALRVPVARLSGAGAADGARGAGSCTCSSPIGASMSCWRWRCW